MPTLRVAEYPRPDHVLLHLSNTHLIAGEEALYGAVDADDRLQRLLDRIEAARIIPSALVAFSLVHVYPETVMHSVVPLDGGPTVGEAVTARQARARLQQGGIVIPDAPQVPRHLNPAVSGTHARQ